MLQVWALLLEKTHPRLATDVIYVAGDRVVSGADTNQHKLSCKMMGFSILNTAPQRLCRTDLLGGPNPKT